jgi:hypothetical protein
MKFSCVNIMCVFQYRKKQSEQELADLRGDLPPWKLSHWKRHSSQDTLADVDNQTLDPEGASLPERKYYKDYMAFLETEIPAIKKQIAVMERRQQQKQQRLVDMESEARTKKHEQEKNGSFDSTSAAKLGQGGAFQAPAEILLDILPEDDGDEDVEEDEDANDDSDMDGLLAVCSIDEPSSARVPSTIPDQQRTHLGDDDDDYDDPNHPHSVTKSDNESEDNDDEQEPSAQNEDKA